MSAEPNKGVVMNLKERFEIYVSVDCSDASKDWLRDNKTNEIVSSERNIFGIKAFLEKAFLGEKRFRIIKPFDGGITPDGVYDEVTSAMFPERGNIAFLKKYCERVIELENLFGDMRARS